MTSMRHTFHTNWTMGGDPQFLDRLHEGLCVFVGDYSCGMPPSASAQHVEDDLLPDEDRITLNLIVELIRDFHAAHVVRARLGRLSANLARLDNLGDEFQDAV